MLSECRGCGTGLPPATGLPGRPVELCERCRQRRGRPVLVPRYDGPLLAAVMREFPAGGDDPEVVLLYELAACLDAAVPGVDVSGVATLSREVRTLTRRLTAVRAGTGDVVHLHGRRQRGVRSVPS